MNKTNKFNVIAVRDNVEAPTNRVSEQHFQEALRTVYQKENAGADWKSQTELRTVQAYGEQLHSQGGLEAMRRAHG